ncbi:phosphoribosyltransferase [Halonotius terrestris]|uniref:Phosphoribosyltransferase n=1 Tax=Halonotius terrestris TaxID=2487750 RepID=A0A8J8TCH7_9EURY|nr:phosphoribosyltransferase [Halonotius terrestris]TQQ83543.1 phosphoribosyltransferase [Halonotius terrestris]
MNERSAEFDCTITNWTYVYGLSQDVASAVKAADFEPDVIVALAPDGWFAGRCLRDLLGIDELASLKIDPSLEAEAAESITDALPAERVADKNVLLVDDIADTGGTLSRAASIVADREASEVRTATLHAIDTSDFTPAFFGDRFEDWQWVIYPWTFTEDMSELIAGVMTSVADDRFSTDEIRDHLASFHGITRAELEMAHPDRLTEVLAEMDRRDLIEAIDADGEQQWELRETTN